MPSKQKKMQESQAGLALAINVEVGAARALLARNNLVDCLSDGLLKAPEFYRPGFPDPGSIAPRHLLLFLQPVAKASFQDDCDESPEDFPVEVAVRLPVDLLLWRITADYEPILASGPEEGDIAVLVPFGLPTKMIDCVLFRTGKELENFKHTHYSNVDPGSVRTGIKDSDDVNNEIQIDKYRLKDAIARVSPRQLILSAYQTANSLVGGLSAVDSFRAVTTTTDSLQWALALLTPVVTDRETQAFQNKYRDRLESDPDLGRLVRLTALARQTVNGDTFYAIAESLMRDDYVPQSPEEELLFRIVTVGLMRCSPSVSIFEFMESVKLQFETLGSAISTGDNSDTEKVQKALDRIVKILNGDSNLPEGLGRWPEAVAGLLLFSLRPELEKTLTWRLEQENLHFTETALLHAILFAGMRLGLSNFPLSLRNTPNSPWIQALLPAFLNTLIPQFYDIHETPSYTLKALKKKTTDTSLLQLISNTDSTLTLRTKPTTPEVEVKPTLPFPGQMSAEIDVVTQNQPVSGEPAQETSETGDRGKPEASEEGTQQEAYLPPLTEQEKASEEETSLVQKLRSAQERTLELERLAVWVCRHLQWWDCVEQNFNLSGIPFELKNTDQGIRLELVGYLPVERKIRWETFQDHVRASDTAQFEEAVRFACKRNSIAR